MALTLDQVWLKRALSLTKETWAWATRRDFALTTMEGTASGAIGGSLRLTFLGREAVANDLAQMFFADDVVVRAEPPEARWQAKSSRLETAGADILVQEMPPFSLRLPRRNAFLHQTLVDAEIALDRGFDAWFSEAVSETLRKNYRRSESRGFRLRWADDDDSLRHFFEAMLVPTAAAQHGERARVPAFAYFKEHRQPGCLLFVDAADGTPLGGLFLLKTRHSPWRLLRLGYAEHVASDKKLCAQVNVRLNVEAIRAACAAGQKAVSMGVSPALAGGGPWRYKAQWGASPGGRLPAYPTCAMWPGSDRGNEALSHYRAFVLRETGVSPFVPRADPTATVDSTVKTDRALARETIDTVAHLGIASVATLILGLGLRILLPRLLGPENLGILYFAESIGAMFFMFLPLGMASYIVREVPGNPERAAVILPSLVPAQGVMALLLYAAMLAFFALSGADRTTLACAAGMGLFSAAAIFQRSILRRTYLALGRSAMTARLEVATRIFLVALILLALAQNASVGTIAACYAVSEIGGVVYLLRRAQRDGYLKGSFDVILFKQMARQSLPFFAVGALIEVYGNVDVAMLRYMTTNHEVAYYGAAGKLKGIGLLLVPIMQAALQPALSKAWRADKAAFERLTSSAMRLLVALSLPITLAMMAVPDLLSDLLFGAEFAPAYRAISCLAPVLALTYLNVLMGTCLNITTNGMAFLGVTAASVVLNICLNGALIPYGNAVFGAGGAAAAAGVATGLSEMFVLVSMRRIFPKGLDYGRLAFLIVATLVPCLVLGATFEELLTLNRWIRLAAVLVGAPLYLLLTGMVRTADVRWLLHVKFGHDRRRPAE